MPDSPIIASVAPVVTPPVAKSGICGTFIVPTQPNGFMPRMSMLLIPFRKPFIALNGIATTLFMPVIIAFTIVLNAFTIPSFIPSKILPPVENTALTAFHAFEKIVPKKFATAENTLLIPSHAALAPFLIVSHAPEKNFPIDSTTDPTVFLIPSNIDFIKLPIFVKIVLTVFHMPLNKFPMNSMACMIKSISTVITATTAPIAIPIAENTAPRTVPRA